jgi:hypothetical protein
MMSWQPSFKVPHPIRQMAEKIMSETRCCSIVSSLFVIMKPTNDASNLPIFKTKRTRTSYPN